ncbi:MAG TPA: hypothetical protein PKY83_03350 [Bacteroidales bacterium]|jgi:hypothetical protein|nr:hypothetical protein [Bacteroidales bacterium]OQC58710.1 MAG: hypothetical protein BWX52_00059 [Bacteroidetes bacterium ADurb.Bin013]MBP8999748.1 hypothetical protein [Bacteroidales bacterium]MBV6455770.1 hypothetical protein [Bacteroidales bacterium]MCZ2315952.1 hypothetical protein [Bacteroidales bacterium]
MEQERVRAIIDRYRSRAQSAREASQIDKSREMEEFADFVEDNLDAFLDEAYTMESELWEEYENY